MSAWKKSQPASWDHWILSKSPNEHSTRHELRGTSRKLVLPSLSCHLCSDICIPLHCVPSYNKLVFYSVHIHHHISFKSRNPDCSHLALTPPLSSQSLLFFPSFPSNSLLISNTYFSNPNRTSERLLYPVSFTNILSSLRDI